MIKLYVDMDGVLTDFRKAVHKLGPKAAEGLAEDASPEQKDYMYKKIEDAGVSFWADMPWSQEGEKLWKKLKKFNPVVLTSPGLFRYAVRGKLNWMNRNLPGEQIFFSNDKHLYAEPDAILIDDMQTNIGPWRETGGYAIKHKNMEDTLQRLKELIKNEPVLRCVSAQLKTLSRRLYEYQSCI